MPMQQMMHHLIHPNARCTNIVRWAKETDMTLARREVEVGLTTCSCYITNVASCRTATDALIEGSQLFSRSGVLSSPQAWRCPVLPVLGGLPVCRSRW